MSLPPVDPHTKGEDRPDAHGSGLEQETEARFQDLIEAAKREDPDAKFLMAAAMSQDDMNWMLGSQGQIEAGKVIQEITERLRNLPESPIVGIFFGVVTAETKDSNGVGTMLEADGFSTAWGMPTVVTQAINDMLMKTILGNKASRR